MQTEISPFSVPTLPRIAFLFIGDENPVFAHESAFRAWMNTFIEARMLANVTPVCITTKSTVTSLQYIVDTVQWLGNNHADFDGAVVFLPRSRVLYGAQLIELMVRQTGKPVVCTTDYGVGQNVQFRSYDSVVMKSDILNAIQVAGSDVSGVMVTAGQEVVAPVDAVTDLSGVRPVIRSASKQLIGKLQFGFVPFSHAIARSEKTLQVDPFSPDVVAYIEVNDSFADRVQAAMQIPQLRGMIIDGGASMPMSVIQHVPKHIPTVLTAHDGNQLYVEGALHALPHMSAAAIGGRFTWLRSHVPALGGGALSDAMENWGHQQYPALNA